MPWLVDWLADFFLFVSLFVYLFICLFVACLLCLFVSLFLFFFSSSPSSAVPFSSPLFLTKSTKMSSWMIFFNASPYAYCIDTGRVYVKKEQQKKTQPTKQTYTNKNNSIKLAWGVRCLQENSQSLSGWQDGSLSWNHPCSSIFRCISWCSLNSLNSTVVLLDAYKPLPELWSIVSGYLTVRTKHPLP